MKLTACYMVKNEEKNLARSLDSLAGVVDDIVVVDTGSTDKTKAIAAAYGAKIYDFPWQDDFSAPRNFAIEQTDADWILFLDADEFFSTRPAIKEFLSRQKRLPDAYMVMRRNQEDGQDKEAGLGMDWCCRLFRRVRELRYQGIIHEQLTRANGELCIANLPQEIFLWHTGYQHGLLEEKLRRNLKLLEKDSQEKGETPHHWLHMIDCYFGLGDYERAYKYALKVRQSELEIFNNETHLYHMLIESMRQLQLPAQDMLPYAEEALQKYPTMPEFHGEKGMILCAMGELLEARKELEAALACYQHPEKWPAQAGYFSRQSAAVVKARLEELYQLEREQENQMEQVRITACYIVRNEAENLARSLASIKGQYDELVVVDTGSTDNTKTVAQEYKARLYDFPWQDDFAAARNFALAQVKTEWVLFLDADEYLSPDSPGKLHDLVTRAGKNELLLFAMQNIEPTSGEVLMEFWAPRCYCYRQERRYIGAIHEELRDNGAIIEAAARVAAEEIMLIHTGYAAAVSKKKARRNLQLLHKALEQEAEPRRLYRYLAEAYDGIGDQKSAEAWALRDVAQGRQSVVYASASYRLLLRYYAQTAQQENRYILAANAVREFPEIPEFHAELAECLASMGNWAEAEQQADLAERTYVNRTGVEPVMFTDAMLDTLRQRRKTWRENLSIENDEVLSVLRRAQQGKTGQYPQQVLTALADNVPQLTRALLALEREQTLAAQALLRRGEKLLPAAMAQVWAAYRNQQGGVPSADDYGLMLKEALIYGDETQRQRFLQLSLQMTTAEVYQAAEAAFKEELWEEAFSIYETIPADAPEVTAEFWHHVGICLYHLRESAAAIECLQRAQTLGCKNRSIPAYIQWSQEQSHD